MIVSGLVLPAAPILLPGITGHPDPEVELLRARCVAALRALVARVPDRLVVVGARRPGEPGGLPEAAEPFLVNDFRPLAGPGTRPHPPDRRPVPALAVAHTLLLDAGIDPARVQWEVVQAGMDPQSCAARGAGLVAGSDRDALVVMGDGSARRREGSPGQVDSRAIPQDAAVEQALIDGDLEQLLALDPDTADALMIAGRPAWQVLAGALGTSAPTASGRRGAEISYSGDPFGVWYVVATFSTE